MVLMEFICHHQPPVQLSVDVLPDSSLPQIHVAATVGAGSVNGGTYVLEFR